MGLLVVVVVAGLVAAGADALGAPWWVRGLAVGAVYGVGGASVLGRPGRVRRRR